MHDSTMFGRALSPVELHNARYLDAITAFRSDTGLCMTQGAGEGGSTGGTGDGGENGQDGSQGGSGEGGGQQGAGRHQSTQENATDAQGNDLGYPKNTPVSEMTETQRAAYGKAKDDERRAAVRAWRSVTGDRTPEQLAADLAELNRLRTERMSESEKAIEEARQQTRSEVAVENVRSAFDLLLPDDMSPEDKEAKLGVLNFSAFLTSDGKVDTAKVKTYAATLTPPAKGDEQQHQTRTWGAGRTDTGGAPLGSAGAAEAERRFGNKSKTNS